MKLPEPTPAALNVEPPDGPIASADRVLAAGARLDEFEIGEIIGQGSTTIVYSATDPAGAVPVAIAEYMPARLARRHHEAQVAPRTSAQADAFRKGLKAFIHETRTLARCNHPSLLRILRLSEANGTAYRVMPRYPATRLIDVRPGMNQPPDEQAVRALLDALLGALGIFHQAGGGHGKVTPSNILLLADHRPLLLGPGAAGRAIAGDRIDALMISVEPCFAPIEQMVESADTALRPSVDLYALAAVARYWISGELPAPAFGTPESPRREKLADTVQRLRATWPRLNYSAALLDALDNALSIYPAERPQDVAQMRERLGHAPAAAAGPARAAPTAALARDDAVRSSPLPVAAPQPALNHVLATSPPSAPHPASASLAPASQPVSYDAVSPSPVSPPAPPDRATQDFDVVMSSAPDSGSPATSGLARSDDDRSGRTTFARQARRPRRIARWIGAVFALVALALVGAFEFGQEGEVARVLGGLGIGRGTSSSDIAAVTAPAAGTAAPAPPPMTADSSASPTAPASPADTGAPTSVPTGITAADSAATAPAATSSDKAPLAAEAGVARPTGSTGADASAGAGAPASPADSSSATPAPAAPVASAGPAISAPPAPASVTPAPTRSAQQRASRGPTSPREVCGARTQFSLYRCMKVQCSQRRWTSHAQCQRLRKTDSVD